VRKNKGQERIGQCFALSLSIDRSMKKNNPGIIIQMKKQRLDSAITLFQASNRLTGWFMFVTPGYHW